MASKNGSEILSPAIAAEAGEEKAWWKRLPRNAVALAAVSLFNDISSEMIYPLLPVFLTSVLGATVAFVGLVEGIAESTASLLKLFSGWLSDKLRRRKSLAVLGYTLSSGTRPLVAAATAGWHVLLVRFFDRVGKGIRTSPRDALLADSTGEADRGLVFGFQRSMDHFGAVIGPLVAFALLGLFPGNLRLVFGLAAIPAAGAVTVLVLFAKEQWASGPSTARAPQLTWKVFDQRFRWFIVIIILFTLGNSSDAFLLLRAKDLGIQMRWIPLLWIVLHLVKTLSSTPGGLLSDRMGRRGVILLGWAVYSLAYWGFAFASQSDEAWLLFAFYGLFYGLTEGVERAFVADLVPAELRGTAYGVYHFAIGVAALPASVIMGLIWQVGSARAAFSFGAALALLSALLLARLVQTPARTR